MSQDGPLTFKSVITRIVNFLFTITVATSTSVVLWNTKQIIQLNTQYAVLEQVTLKTSDAQDIIRQINETNLRVSVLEERTKSGNDEWIRREIEGLKQVQQELNSRLNSVLRAK